jgi:hypothetical protein
MVTWKSIVLEHQRGQAKVSNVGLGKQQAVTKRQYACGIVVIELKRAKFGPMDPVLRFSIFTVGYEEAARFPTSQIALITLENDSHD